MTTESLFNAESWIAQHCLGGEVLDAQTVRVISNFTLMWNLFEATICDTNANVKCFEQVAEYIARNNRPTLGITDGIQFWKSRYWSATKFNSRFEKLNFRKADRRKFVEEVLCGAKSDIESQIVGTLIIIYRLRNNLFHGEKDVRELNNQVSNLDTANKALASVLEASGHPLVH